MTNDDLKRFYPQNSTPEKSNDFVRYNANGEIPGVGGNGGEHETVIIDALPTATQGEITQEQLTTLQKNDANTLLFADEIYRLSDKRTSEGYLIYSHACQDNTDNFYIKCITVTISTLGWVLTSLNIGGKKYQHNIYAYVGSGPSFQYSLYFNYISTTPTPFTGMIALGKDIYNHYGDTSISASGHVSDGGVDYNINRIVGRNNEDSKYDGVFIGYYRLRPTKTTVTINDVEYSFVTDISYNSTGKNVDSASEITDIVTEI